MSNEAPAPGKIYTALPAILAEVGAVGKNRRNEQQGYNYRSCDDVCDAVRPLLGKHGVFAIKKVVEKSQEDFKTRNGALMIWVKMKCIWTFYAGDGSSVSTESYGEGMDLGDKAINKAETGSLKNAMLQMFLVMGHEDSEVDGPQDEGRDETRRQRSDDGPGRPPQQDRGPPSQRGQQGKTQEPMPEKCPKCGSTGSIHRKRNGGFSCWQSEGGCEHTWTTPQAIANSTPGLTTGDKIPPPHPESQPGSTPVTGTLLPPEKKSIFDLASESIAQTVDLRDLTILRNVEAKVRERYNESKLTDKEFVELGNKISDAEAAIQAVLG